MIAASHTVHVRYSLGFVFFSFCLSHCFRWWCLIESPAASRKNYSLQSMAPFSYNSHPIYLLLCTMAAKKRRYIGRQRRRCGHTKNAMDLYTSIRTQHTHGILSNVARTIFSLRTLHTCWCWCCAVLCWWLAFMLCMRARLYT